jgi:hypothetical protein
MNLTTSLYLLSVTQEEFSVLDHVSGVNFNLESIDSVACLKPLSCIGT